MLRAEAGQLKQMANNVAERAVRSQIDPLIQKIDELACRIEALEKATKPEAKPKGTKDGKL